MRARVRPSSVSVAVALSATGALLLLPWPRAVGAASDLADATLVQLTNTQVDAIGLKAYSGRYGSAVSTTLGQDDPGDFSDPDGMLSRISVATRTTRTSARSGKYDAQAQLTDLRVFFNGKDLVRVRSTGGGVASLDSYAECVPPPVGPYALAYNRTDSGEITVLGQRVPIGTTTLDITGADLGRTDVGPSTLTVTVTPHEDPARQSRVYTAAAWLDIEVSGALDDTGGKELYQGPVTRLRLGEVHANCSTADLPGTPTPTPGGSDTPAPPEDSGSPTPPTGSPSVPILTLSPSASASPSASPSAPASGSPEPSPGRTSSGPTPPSPSQAGTGTPGGNPPTGEGGRGGGLAPTGSDGNGVLFAATGSGLIALGGAAVVLARRRPSRRR